MDEKDKEIIALRHRVNDLKKELSYWQEKGRDNLEPFKEKTILHIRGFYPELTSAYTDKEIAQAYHEYCDINHACSWTECNLIDFMAWANNSPLEGLKANRLEE